MSSTAMSDAVGPNLFVVGAAKSGTTSLWAHLDAHPDIYMSHPKEPHFFSRATVPVDMVVKDPASATPWNGRMRTTGGTSAWASTSGRSPRWCTES
ncbi:MAG: hypothetical protein ABI717_04260 [Actinomycetota bacterium]